MVDLANARLKGFAELRIDGRKRLIEQEHLRLGHDRAGERRALLLAAGKARGVGALFAGELDHGDGLGHLLVDHVLRGLLHLEAEGDVLLDRHVGEQAVLLEHHADVALARRHVGDILAVEDDGALGDLLQARKAAQQGGFAAAGGAKQRHKVTLLDTEIDVIEDGVVAKALDDVAEFNIGHYLVSFWIDEFCSFKTTAVTSATTTKMTTTMALERPLETSMFACRNTWMFW